MKKLLHGLSIYNLSVLLLLIMHALTGENPSKNAFFALLFLPTAIYFIQTLIMKSPIIKVRLLQKNHKILRTILRWYSIVFVTVLFVALIKNIENYFELLFISLFSPLALYFVLLAVDSIRARKVEEKDKPIELTITGPEIDYIKEKDRRQFMKLLAGAGLGVLITGLINPQKIGAAFFGSVPGPGTISLKDTTGTKIDPAIKAPTDGYGVTNTYTTALPYYYGFVNKDSAWYIIKEVGDGSFLYARGASGYDWDNRASATYDTYDNTF